ncbi:MAG: CoA transferase [Deltaproteobacteria bacterium]|nr:CoA transferase [Deltaproteobacteria bacterium]
MHPLEGIKVLDFSTMLNGPYTAMLLSDMGADVIKVEPPDGDSWRAVGGGFIACNRGKRAICVDLKKEEAKPIIFSMIERSDVLVENARWGVWHRLGLDYESVIKIKPDLIYVSVLGHGSSGPLSKTAGYDPLLQSRSGESVSQGGLGKPPVFHAIPLNDLATPMLGAWGAVLALLARVRSGKGKGQHVESSLTNASIALQSGTFIDYPGLERKYPGDTGLKGLSASHRLYETQDKRWIFIMAYQPEHWSSLCQVLGQETLLSDPRFENEPDRKKNDQTLVEIFIEAFKGKPAAEWVSALSQAGVPVALGQSAEEVIRDPHCDANNYFAQIQDPDFGPVRLPGVGPQFSGMSGIIRRAAPKLGHHTEEILKELGYTEEQINTLKNNRIIFQADRPIDRA